MPNIQQQKERFLAIVREHIHRKGAEELIKGLERTDFFTAPASTKYHGAYPGGLCEHSLDVWEYAQSLKFLSPEPINDESLCIAALFHDLCKLNFYKPGKKNQKINGVWKEVDCYTVEEAIPFGGHGSKSVYLLQRFMPLKVEEAVAINCHMGFSDATPGQVGSISSAFKKYPLAWIIHVADEAATYLLNRDPPES